MDRGIILNLTMILVDMLSLLLIIPLASAQISIDIHPCTETSNTTIDISGEYARNTTENDLKFSKITQTYMKDMVVAAGYRRPSKIYFFESTYYGIQPLKTVIRPVKVNILSTEEEIVTLANKEFDNTSPYAVNTKNEFAPLKTESINTTLSQNAIMPLDRKIKMHTMHSDLQLTSDGEKGKYHQYAQKSTTTKSTIEFMMGNEEKARVVLRSTKIQVKVQIEYEAYITGQAYYAYKLLGVTLSSGSINVQNEKCLPFYETLDLEYYYRDRVDIEEIDNYDDMIQI